MFKWLLLLGGLELENNFSLLQPLRDVDFALEEKRP